MNQIKCYFHPEWPAIKKCESCKRYFCKVCIDKDSKQCFACRYVKLSKKGEFKEELEIDTIRIRKFSFSENGIVYSIPQIWIGNWKEFKLFPFLSIYFLSLPLPHEKVEIFYESGEHNQVISIWSQGAGEDEDKGYRESNIGFKQKIPENPKNAISEEIELEKPTLLFSAGDIRHFTTFIEKIGSFLRSLLPFLIAGILIILLSNFFRKYPAAITWVEIMSVALGILSIVYFLKFLSKYNRPSLWSPSISEIEGKVDKNLVPSDDIPEGFLKWSATKLGTRKGWQIFLRVIDGGGRKIRVLIEGLGERPEQIPEIGKKYKFGGRELYNVLICNLEEKDHFVRPA